jgi:hypothetical protein
MPTQVTGTIEFVQHIADGRVLKSSSLKISVMPFFYEVDGKRESFDGVVSQAVTDDAMNYVFIDNDGDLQVNTTGWPNNTHIRLAIVATSGGSIVEIENHRVFLAAGLAREINWEKDDALETTTSTDWQEKISLSGVQLPAGTYMVEWYAEVKHINDTIGQYCEARVEADDSVEIGFSSWHFSTWEDFGGMILHTFATDGTHHFDIDFRAQGGGTAGIRRARLLVWRIG